MRAHAAELEVKSPEAIVVSGTQVTTALLQIVKAIPVVFVNVSDPLGRGLIRDWSHPAGNATGFASFDPTFSAKWLEVLKEISPATRRVLVLFDHENPGTSAYLQPIQSASQSLGLQVIATNVATSVEAERYIEAFAKEADSGLILLPSASANTYRQTSVYAYSSFVRDGGLVSYSTDQTFQYQGAATYIDRILKGERPADLPVQAPTKFELVINLKTARAIGLTVPPLLLARADEVAGRPAFESRQGTKPRVGNAPIRRVDHSGRMPPTCEGQDLPDRPAC
jgi:putative ABC transport system substrate-binding protein